MATPAPSWDLIALARSHVDAALRAIEMAGRPDQHPAPSSDRMRQAANSLRSAAETLHPGRPDPVFLADAFTAGARWAWRTKGAEPRVDDAPPISQVADAFERFHGARVNLPEPNEARAWRDQPDVVLAVLRMAFEAGDGGLTFDAFLDSLNDHPEFIVAGDPRRALRHAFDAGRTSAFAYVSEPAGHPEDDADDRFLHYWRTLKPGVAGGVS
jgi:hypothetical protein